MSANLGCDKVWELSDAQHQGHEPTLEETSFKEAHLRECSLCALEQSLHARLGDLEAEGPAPTLTEAQERGWVERVMWHDDQAQGAFDETPLQPEPRWRRVGLAVAIAAGLVLLAVPAWRASTSATTVVPQLFLASGEVSTHEVAGATGSSQAGDALPAGSMVAVAEGRAALKLGGETLVFLSPHTRLKVNVATSKLFELGLETGEVVLDIAGLHGGRVVVKTAAGMAEALGTVFAVSVNSQGTEVRVERGVVLVTPGAGPERRLLANEGVLMGRETRALSPAEMTRDRKAIEWAEPTRREQSALLTIGSEPGGGTVYIDSRELGHTPLSAFISPGERSVELRAPGAAPIREKVHAEVGGNLSRSYVVHPAEPVEAPIAQPVVTATPKEPKDKPAMRPPPGPRGPGVSRQHRDETWQAPVSGGGGSLGPGPAELMEQAKVSRAQSDWSGAANAYRELTERYPKSSEVRASLVPYAQLLLDRLHEPRLALAIFQRYLDEVRGPLSEEASWGRIKALEKLGRRSDEVTFLREFLRLYSSSLEGSAARRRLDELGESP